MDTNGGNTCHYEGSNIASFPGSFSFKLCLCEYYSQKFEGEGEPGTEPCPPMAFLAMVEQEFNYLRMATGGHGSVPGSPSLQKIFVYNIRVGEV